MIFTILVLGKLTTMVEFIEHYHNKAQPSYEVKIIYDKFFPICDISSNQIDRVYHFDQEVKLPATLNTNPMGRLTLIVPVTEFKGIELNFAVNNFEYSVALYLSLIQRIQSSDFFDSSVQKRLNALFSPLLDMKHHKIEASDLVHGNPLISASHLKHINAGKLHDRKSGNSVHVKRDNIDVLGKIGYNARRAFNVFFQVLSSMGVLVFNFFQGIMALRRWDLVLSTQKLINKYHDGTVPIMKQGTLAMRPQFLDLVNNWRANSSASFLEKIKNKDVNSHEDIYKKWEQRDVGSMTLEDLTFHHIHNVTAPSSTHSMIEEHAKLLNNVATKLYAVATPDVVLKMKQIELNTGANWYDSAVVNLLKTAYGLFDVALQVLQSTSNIVFDIVTPIVDFMQKLISIKIDIPGLQSFFSSISKTDLTIMNLLTLNTAMFMNWNLQIFTKQPFILSVQEMDILTSDTNPMKWMLNYYSDHRTGPYTKEKELKLGQLLDWMPRCQMMHFQYVGIFFGDLQVWTDSISVIKPITNQFSYLDLLAFAMNYMYLIPYYPVDFVTDLSQIDDKIAHPDKYWFTWYLHWFIEVIAGAIHSMHSVFKWTSSILGLGYIGDTYNNIRFMIKSIIIGLPQLVIIAWISNNVWENTDSNDADRLAITVVNTMAWSVDTASYLFMMILSRMRDDSILINGMSVGLVSTLIDATMLGLYHSRLGLMMMSGKYGLID
eukprot:NODE_128_length_18581_cov_0.247538.p3 type:complete len:717 gc:universal NODE_128_length_18581_cov_0.247538:11327-13477(+)